MIGSNDVYLFAGDSLTEGVYGADYVARIAAAVDGGRLSQEGQVRLSQEGQVVNAGRGGDTVTSLLARIDGLLQQYRPQWVILQIGTNDVWFPWLAGHSLGWWLWLGYRRLRTGQKPSRDLDRFAAAYRGLIDRARAAGAQVLVCTVAPMGERLSSPLNQQVARLNGVIKHVAADRQVPVADVWQAFVEEIACLPQGSGYTSGEWLFTLLDRSRYKSQGAEAMAQRRRLHLTFDGIHLTSQGADLWANTVLAALVAAQGDREALLSTATSQADLACFEQGSLPVCCSPGWEARAHGLADLLSGAYDDLASVTDARPSLSLAVLNELHWHSSPCPGPYPRPRALWDGESGTVFAPDAYDEGFLRDWHLPEAVAASASWPRDLAELGELAQATALADLLALQEMARLFLHHLRVAPADPPLARLLAAYLVQVVLQRQTGDDATLAALWNAWGRLLARAGKEEGRIRLQALDLFREQGVDLVSALAGHEPAAEDRVRASLAATISEP